MNKDKDDGVGGFDLWLYHAGEGWWLEESGVATVSKAAAMLVGKVGTGEEHSRRGGASSRQTAWWQN